jgi:hypothetical protein
MQTAFGSAEMRSAAALGTSILTLLLGTTLATAQHGQRDHEDHKHEGNVHQQEHGRQAFGVLLVYLGATHVAFFDQGFEIPNFGILSVFIGGSS